MRKEAAKGRLTLEPITGKDFATLAAINAMRSERRIGDPKRSRPLQSARQSGRSKTRLLMHIKRQTGPVSGRKLAS